MLLLLALVLLQVSGDKELQLTDKYCTLRHVAGRLHLRLQYLNLALTVSSLQIVH